VVALDAGHGGSPDNAHPERPFDPGAVAASNGLMEKDLTLEVARRVRELLRQERVEVVMTRDSDVFVDISPRMQQAIDMGARLFVSIHMNSWTDAAANGSVVLYPNDASLSFARVMEDAVSRGLGRYGVAADGVLLKDTLWVHATMPAVTVEPLYLSNPREADLMLRDDVRSQLARAIVDGIEAQAPEIAARKAEITRWDAAHGVSAPAGGAYPGGSGAVRTTDAAPTVSAIWPPSLLLTALLLAALALALRWRRRLVHACALGVRAFVDTLDRLDDGRPLTVPPVLGRGRRRAARRRRSLARARRPAHRRSVYDELWF